MHYAETQPAPPLQHLVRCYWAFAAAHDEAPYLHRVMPDGCVSLVAVGAASPVVLIVGPTLREIPVPVGPGSRYWGVRLWPDAAGPLLGLAPLTLRDVVAPAAGLVPALAARLALALDGSPPLAAAARRLDAALLHEAVPPSTALDAPVRRVVEAVGAAQGHVAIGALAEAAALSPRQLQRRFRRAVGLTAKELARIRRFRFATAHLLQPAPTASWGAVAAEAGYADQAHLVREFNALVGLSPTAFEAHVARINHGDVDP